MTHVLPHRSIVKTDARFGAVVPKHVVGNVSSSNDETFDWRILKRLSAVRNQGSCGSCWAVATTTAVADHFVVKGITKTVPALSYTRNMICYSDDPCNGGNPAALLKMASENPHGFVEESCVEEDSWCGSGGCSAKHFASVFGKCGCMKNSNFLCYPIDRDSVQWLTDDGRNAKFSEYVKTWISKEGPLVAAFPVFKNFDPKLFVNSVYIESKTSAGDFDHLAALDHSEFLGFHAVVVVGWGIEHEIPTGPKRVQSVPYWLCRNSWGPRWNGDGHFKMPFYPFNSTVQFEKPVSIADPGGNVVHEAGGFVCFTVSKDPFVAKIPKTIVVESGNFKIKVILSIASVFAVFIVFLIFYRLKYGRRF